MIKLTIDPEKALYARVAGLLYLIIIVSGISSEVFVRGSLIVDGDGAATAANILASSALFKLGFVADSIMLLSDVAIAILFYVLLKHVHQTLAIIAAAFRLTQAAILGVNLLNYYAAYLLAHGKAPAPDHAYALVSFFLDLHSYGYDLGLIFFGVSNLVLGYLVAKSKYFPAILGYGLQASAVVYLVGSYARFLSPDLMPIIEPMYLVPLVAELSFCLWLLVKGVRFEVQNSIEG